MRATGRFASFSFITRLIAASALTALALTACGGGYGGGSGAAAGVTCGGTYAPCPAPTVALTAPAANATVSGTSVALTATATAATMDGVTVARVDFFVDATMVGTAATSPYTVNWDSTKVADGSHAVTAKVTDSVNGTATTPATTITVMNAAAANVVMTPAQVFPMPRSSASGTASLTFKLETGATRGTVQLRGLSATGVTINEGFAGSSGAAVIRLSPASSAAGEWQVPDGALLTPEQVNALTQGRLYVIATSAANPGGEVRGQIAPQNVIVSFSDLAASQEAAAMGIVASGVAATTVDTSANTLTIHVNSSGVDDAMSAQVSTGAKTAELARDSVSLGHWSTELAAISAAEVASFKAGRWQASVATPVAQGGAIRGQINPGKTD
jgi:CHRD domain/Bacterial Ig domain